MHLKKQHSYILLWCLHAYSLCPHADQHAHGSCTLVWSFLCKSFAFSPPGYLGEVSCVDDHYMVTFVHCVCVCVCVRGEGGGGM